MVHRFVPRCQFGCGCGWFGHGSVPCVGVVCWWLLVGGESTVSRQWVQPPVLLAEPGAGPVVCARWCPTLPHPGGCSTIGAVRLSFRVRDGYRAFPCRCDHRDDYVGSARPSSLVRVYSVVRVAACRPARTHACVVCVCWWCGLGVDRIVDASRLLFRSPPHSHARWVCGVCWGCCCLCWPISTSQLTDRYRSSTPGLSTQ